MMTRLPAPAQSGSPADKWRFGRVPAGYLIALSAVIIALAVGFVVQEFVPHANLSLLFLTAVLIVAACAGPAPALLAAVLSVLAFAFFFTAPYHSLLVASESDAATLLFFLLITAVTGHLAVRMRREMASKRAALERISKLYAFGRRMAAAASTGEVIEGLTHEVARALPGTVIALLSDGEAAPRPRSCDGAKEPPNESEICTAWEAPNTESVAGFWTFLALQTTRGRIGMLAVQPRPVDSEQLVLARSLCDQAALALDRIRLVDDIQRERRFTETERLRSALLSSVSHDLRTPLASIIGSTTSLLEYSQAISPENQRELLNTVVEDAQRLDGYIQNLLDMTRLGQGRLRPRCDWVDIRDLIAAAVVRTHRSPGAPRPVIDIAPDIPLLWAQGALLEQTLVNLIDNAQRFSPPGIPVEITARSDNDEAIIEVCDQGTGIPEMEQEKIFDMFYTVHRPDLDQPQGTGLGLAICRGLVAAHGGRISAHRGRGDRGACLRVELPLTTAKPEDDGA